MRSTVASLLDRCLLTRSPGKTLIIASLGCLLGSYLIILALQIYLDSQNIYPEETGDFITINKKVKGGLLQNFNQADKAFKPDELEKISNLPGVSDIGGFSRNHFPVTVHIWPAGKIGLGSAARADLFFESISERFLDLKPEEWKWEENQSFVPIMVPKFYLDLWNFGLAPSRSEYPALSMESASSMPIEIFIGENQSVRMVGKFVAFSKRINSVLVPEQFLQWANDRYGLQKNEKFFFVWKDDEINGPPVSLRSLKEREKNGDTIMIVSEITKPEKKLKFREVKDKKTAKEDPARLIVKLDHSSGDAFFQSVKKIGYETNREQPKFDWINQAVRIVSWSVAGLGSLLSLLSLATFTSSFRLMMAQSKEIARNLIYLGFAPSEISKIFQQRFNKLFWAIFTVSLFAVFVTKVLMKKLLIDYGLELSSSLAWQTWLGGLVYALIFVRINHTVIGQTVLSFSKQGKNN